MTQEEKDRLRAFALLLDRGGFYQLTPLQKRIDLCRSHQTAEEMFQAALDQGLLTPIKRMRPELLDSLNASQGVGGNEPMEGCEPDPSID